MAGFKWKVTPSRGWDAQIYQDALDSGQERVLNNKQAPILESEAKRDAPWEDQTSNARQTLAAFAIKIEGPTTAVANTYEGEVDDIYAPFGRGEGWALILRQSMSYGRALELNRQGKFGVILFILDLNQHVVWEDLVNQLGLKTRRG